MAKIKEAYDSNSALILALEDRDDIYNSILQNYELYDLDDEEIAKIKKYKELSQFERDLLFLESKMKMKDIADLYEVSKTHLYKRLRIIRKKLNN